MISKEQEARYQDLLKERKRLMKRSNKSVIRTFLVSIVIGLIIGLLAAAVLIISDMHGVMDIDKAMWVFYIGLILFFILHIMIHEAGHLVFGLMTGYKFLSFRVFSTIFYMKNERLTKGKLAVAGTAGQCLMYPPERRPDGSFPYALYNLGGGISNLILSLIFVILTIITNNSYFRLSFLEFVIIGVLTAVTNLIPIRMGIQNDGKNYLSMRKDKSMRDAFYLQLKVNAEMSNGKQITEYSPEEFMLPEGINDTNMLLSSIRFYSYYQQLAFHNYEAAEQILASMEEKSSGYLAFTLNSIMMERLFFQVINHKSIEEIASVYEFCRLPMEKSKSDIGVQRVRYLYEKLLTVDEKLDIVTLIGKKARNSLNVSNPDQLYRQFLQTARNHPSPGLAELFVGMVDDVMNKKTNSDIV